MSMKPVVNRIEVENEDLLIVLYVNAQEPVGKALRDRYGLLGTPTFLLFDSQGDELMRTFGVVDPREVSRLIGKP